MNKLAKNIYVQLLPIAKTETDFKILLVKWNHGNFANRYTGLIKLTEFKADQNICPDALGSTAKALLPKGITDQQDVEPKLGAILEFTDPPACDEYVYLAYVQDNCNHETFDGSPCEWFNLNEIPYQEMPADDALWYPKVLAGKLIRGSFTFGGWEEKQLQSHWIKEVDKLF